MGGSIWREGVDDDGLFGRSAGRWVVWKVGRLH